MQPVEDDHQSPYPVPACDICYSRKVRCDRGIPCSNCQDQNVPCLRQRNRRRLPKRARATTASTDCDQSNSPSLVLPMTTPGISPPSRCPDHQKNIPQYFYDETLEANDADIPGPSFSHSEPPAPAPARSALPSWVPRPIEIDFNPWENNDGLKQEVIRQAQQVLQSALMNATQTVPTSKTGLALNNERFESSEPVSPEFLTWMLHDIGSAKGGSYVWDYFKHVSKSSLKHMGLSLLTNKASKDEKDIFTVCLSAAAHKFLVTMLSSEEHDDDLTEHLQQRLLSHKRTALAALDRIRLVATPSLALLQAILCGIFIHQGSGNARFAYDLTRTACRVATDLELHLLRPNGSKDSRTEEESFCLLWCYMLDKNYAWKFQPSRWFFDPEPGLIDQHVAGTASELLTIYVIMAQVQDETLLLSKDLLSREPQSTQHTLRNSTALLLTRMERVRQRIEKIALASPACWKGLEPANEIAALQFSHNSICTMVLYLSEQSDGQALGFGELTLRYARQELSSLVAICLIGEKHRAVGFLHWTLIYYPLTAWFVLFCNTVTSCHLEDLNLLKTLASVLMPSVSLSHPITVIQRLCEDFITLSQSHFAILDGDAEATVGNPTSPLHNQSLWHNESANSGIAPLAANNTGSVASGIYDMFASTGADNSAYFDLLTSDAIPLELSGDFFVSDIS